MKDNRTASPVVIKSFASKEIRPGETWKVYLRAADSDGDMTKIICLVSQPGRVPYPVCWVRIPENRRRELSGFLYLNTGGRQGLAFTLLSLRIEIQDDAGNISRPVSFSLEFNPRAEPENPPLGVFSEEEIGPIMVSLDPGSGFP